MLRERGSRQVLNGKQRLIYNDLTTMPKACRLTVGAAWLALLLLLGPAHAQLRGHGGPIRALAVSAVQKQNLLGEIVAKRPADS